MDQPLKSPRTVVNELIADGRFIEALGYLHGQLDAREKRELDPHLLLMRGRIYRLLGQTDDAICDAETYIAESGNSTDGHVLASEVYCDVGRYAESKRHIDCILAQDKSNFPALNALLRLERMHGSSENAIRACKLILTYYPSREIFYSTLSELVEKSQPRKVLPLLRRIKGTPAYTSGMEGRRKLAQARALADRRLLQTYKRDLQASRSTDSLWRVAKTLGNLGFPNVARRILVCHLNKFCLDPACVPHVGLHKLLTSSIEQSGDLQGALFTARTLMASYADTSAKLSSDVVRLLRKTGEVEAAYSVGAALIAKHDGELGLVSETIKAAKQLDNPRDHVAHIFDILSASCGTTYEELNLLFECLLWVENFSQPSAFSGESSRRRTIPHNIIQFWDNPSVPPDIKGAMDNVAKVNPNFTHYVFSEADARSFIEQNLTTDHIMAFDKCTHPAMKADYFRMAALFVMGGVYIDADMTTRASIGYLLDLYDRDIILNLNNAAFPAHLANWFIASAPRQPVMETALSIATKKLVEKDKPDIWRDTGPGNLTEAFCLTFKKYQNSENREQFVKSVALITIPLFRQFVVDVDAYYKATAAGNWRFSTH